MNTAILHLVLVLLGLTGYLLAQYIYRKKNDPDKPLVCPLKSNCDVVITSRYATIAGIPVESLGMIYYIVIAVFHTLIFAWPAFGTTFMLQLSVLISAVALVFSVYLVCIQAFVLKQWCTWCLCSAFLCAAIVLETIASLPAGVLKNLVF